MKGCKHNMKTQQDFFSGALTLLRGVFLCKPRGHCTSHVPRNQKTTGNEVLVPSVWCMHGIESQSGISMCSKGFGNVHVDVFGSKEIDGVERKGKERNKVKIVDPYTCIPSSTKPPGFDRADKEVGPGICSERTCKGKTLTFSVSCWIGNRHIIRCH